MSDLSYESFKKEALEDPETKKAYEEIQKMCATCGQDESDCPTRSGCFTPKYKNWIEPGIAKDSAFCSKCEHWRAVKIGKYCPDCGQTL